MYEGLCVIGNRELLHVLLAYRLDKAEDNSYATHALDDEFSDTLLAPRLQDLDYSCIIRTSYSSHASSITPLLRSNSS